MLKNEQAMEAFEELLKALETSDARSEALFQILPQKRLVSEQDLEGAVIGVKAKNKNKWTQLRAKLTSILKEQPDI